MLVACVGAYYAEAMSCLLMNYIYVFTYKTYLPIPSSDADRKLIIHVNCVCIYYSVDICYYPETSAGLHTTNIFHLLSNGTPPNKIKMYLCLGIVDIYF